MAESSKPDTKKIDKENVLAQALNNLDDPNQIFQYLESKQRTVQLYSFLTALVRQKYKSIQYRLTDYLLPGCPLNMFSTDWDGSIPSGYFEQFSHKSLLPSVISPEVRNVDKKDPIVELIAQKRDWKMKWTYDKKHYESLRLRKDHKWLNEDVLQCPEYYVDIVKNLELNPDEYFESKYNWYYTGKGNLQLISIYGTDYLLHSEFNCVYVSPFYKDNTIVDYNYSISFELEENANIFETIYSNNIIALRTKLKVVLLKVEPTDDGFNLKRIKTVESMWAFTSITFDEYHKNILYLTTIENELIIINLDRMKRRTVKIRGKLNTLTDNWNTVLSTQRECYLHVNSKCITYYDKRTNEAYERWKSIKYLADVEICNKITAATFCMGRPQMYLGTTHHLFLLDTRCNRKSLRPKAVQRWTHGMRVPPTYFSMCEDKEYNKDMLCYSSQWPEDLALLSNYSDILERREHLNSIVHPYRPPNLMDTFREAQIKNLTFTYMERVKERLVTTISGLTMFKQEDNYVVLMQNSLGDISRYMLYPQSRISDIEDDNPMLLSDWCSKIKFNTQSTVCTHLFDVSAMWKRLNLIPDSFFIGRKVHKVQEYRFNEQEIYDTFEKGEVDPQFLEIWKTNTNNGLTASNDMIVDDVLEDTQKFDETSINQNYNQSQNYTIGNTNELPDDEF